MSFWKKIFSWFRRKVRVGLYLRVETKTGTILKVTIDGFDSNFSGSVSGIIIEDFKINKKTLPLINEIRNKNINWKEVPLHFKKKVKNNRVKVKWNQIKGYLI